jgi:hypothetical protein
MLVLLRILFGAALLYEMAEGAKVAPSTVGQAGDMTGAFYVAVCVGLGILNALVWAPYLGATLSRPLTGVISESTYVERINWVLRLAHWLENRRWRRATLAICFWEAVRHPSAPAAFVMGFRNARPGSWLEKVFAREVFRLSNVQNCVQAYLALKRHGIDPRPHSSQEVNIVLLSLERPPRAEASVMAVPAAARPTAIPRNPRIRLFNRAERSSTGQEREDGSERAPEPAGNAPAELPPQSEVDPEPAPAAQSRWFSNILARVISFLRAE